MVPKAPTFLVPAPTMPMASQIGSVIGNHNQMSNTDFDDALTAGAHVTLACLVRLDRMHHVPVEPVQWSR